MRPAAAAGAADAVPGGAVAATAAEAAADGAGAAPHALAARAQQFLDFAATECLHDPLYVALCGLLAQRPEALAWLDAAAPTQRRPNLLLAAIHERVLDGAGGALAAYFGSAGGTRAPDAALGAALDALLEREQARLRTLIAHRRTQTNEIGRCAVLWPALGEIAERTGAPALALLDFGCSAGLNLGVDRYRYAHGALRLGALHDADAPLVACHPVHGRGPRARTAPHVAQRLGLDPAPVDVHDAAALRWLRACLWPHDRARAERFDRAALIVRAGRWPVRQADDCFAGIEPWLDTLPADVQPVVFNSWVLAYFEPAALHAHVTAMRALVQRRRIAWLSAEGPGLVLGAPPAPLAGDARVSAAELANASLWWLTLPGPTAPLTTLVARSHAHGHWAHWDDA